ncbi:hypothetical protein [Blastopirellula marina]|uniref:Uncharacterized protein n=1 Tax=Blastopirellula marina TaxID=124 RepID=A0A2S8GQX6_9BACT|nr:hypothetical protein [Blastopirellula marina]PQO35602.1 hypothetical protein C5Y98_13240 [Blastopirellula marina]PQO46802.1 hypothetical protein C5Y93_06515 [Blastopirellula marina]PTL44242.1 hypothetical protein C5Y97_13250 [Blastopirellula marina]
MLKLSKGWMFVAAIGKGFIFSMALVGFVRIGYWMSGQELSQVAADRLFMISSLLAGTLAATIYGIKLKRTGADSPS